MKLRSRLREFWREHLLPRWREYQWPLAAVLGLAAVLLGWFGFWKYFAAVGEPRSPLDVLYTTLQLFTLESGSVSGPVPWELEVARLLAPAVAGFMAFKALATLFRDEFRLFWLRFTDGHVVIFGLGRKGMLLARAFRQLGDRVVAVEKDEGNDMIEPCREDGAIVVIGDARDPHLLRRVQVGGARVVISVSGDDGVNAEVAVRTRALAARSEGNGLTALIHIVDPRLCTLLRMRELCAGVEDAFVLDYFNVFESGARELLDERSPFDQEGDVDCPHIVLVGLGRFGETLLVEMAKRWKKDTLDNTGSRLRVTVVDRVAENKTGSLAVRYPKLESVCDLEAVQLDVNSPEFEKGDFLLARSGRCDVSYVCVCLDDESSALSAALTLHHRLSGRKVPIVVRMAYEAGLGVLLARQGGNVEYENLHAFGLLDRTCRPELLFAGTREVLSRAIHEHYLEEDKAREEQEKAAGRTPAKNPSAVSWDELPEDLKESNRHQASHIGDKLDAVGCFLAPLTDWDADKFEFKVEEVERLAEMEHERFIEERTARGWTRSLGAKDVHEGTSPDLIPWAKLPDKGRRKDRKTITDLPEVLWIAGFQIVRRAGTD